jgi:CMP-N-acetylneuraminic acid synthetase
VAQALKNIMSTLGIIIARAGSVGLPNKHLLPLLGRPVIEYTLEHARQAGRLDRTVVSSDCPRVLGLARARGLPIIPRPPHLATPQASVQDVLLHALAALEAEESFRAGSIVLLYGNVPVRGPDVIDRAIARLVESGCDSVRSFCPVGKWHPGWMARLNGDVVEPLRPGSIHRRQDLEPLYLHDGAVVAVSRESLLRALDRRDDPHAFFGVDRRGIETQMGETVEIDDLRDLYWAEAVLRARTERIRMAS